MDMACVKEELTRRGLPTHGLKPALTKRLQQAIDNLAQPLFVHAPGINVLSDECLGKLMVCAVKRGSTANLGSPWSPGYVYPMTGVSPRALALVGTRWHKVTKDPEIWRMSDVLEVLHQYAVVGHAAGQLIPKSRWAAVLALLHRVSPLSGARECIEEMDSRYDDMSEDEAEACAEEGFGLSDLEQVLSGFTVTPRDNAPRVFPRLVFYLVVTGCVDGGTDSDQSYNISLLQRTGKTQRPLLYITDAVTSTKQRVQMRLAEDDVIETLASALGLPEAWTHQEVLQLLAGVAAATTPQSMRVCEGMNGVDILKEAIWYSDWAGMNFSDAGGPGHYRLPRHQYFGLNFFSEKHNYYPGVRAAVEAHAL